MPMLQLLHIKHLKIEIYYIGDQDDDFVLESDHIVHNFTHTYNYYINIIFMLTDIIQLVTN